MCATVFFSAFRSQFASVSQGDSKVTKLVIDNVEYDAEALSPEALGQVQSIQFVDAEVERLSARVAAMNTARIAYSAALQELLISEGDNRCVGES